MNFSVTKKSGIKAKGKSVCKDGKTKKAETEIGENAEPFEAEVDEMLVLWSYKKDEEDSVLVIESFSAGSFSIKKANNSKRWEITVKSDSSLDPDITTVNVEIGDIRQS